jgi:hypothetical protein
MKLLAMLFAAAAVSVAIWVPFEGRTGWQRLEERWTGKPAPPRVRAVQAPASAGPRPMGPRQTEPRSAARPLPARPGPSRPQERGAPAAGTPHPTPSRDLAPEALRELARRGAPEQHPRTLAARSPPAGHSGIARAAPPEAIAPSDRAALEILIGGARKAQAGPTPERRSTGPEERL